ncbi:pyridoxamine 5'-phosphate oxidase family protein [Streptomyces yaizuensis]|uniref:Pyridoxamine 5'-phosphate oxidase family protein n=1 Tax=Streptomyces yaizuensis TaxID=2989713 RepID=A0ABQ5NU27_9ACTN|nr:pyridoxamine 5'-phosphate oxidase family protein [Streptomyces sp. YSPA8]GLF93757.1 pyridoxamine 5'-phosphate oxidase family protein [Streptomyces sp. YSPA8]
MSDPNPNPAPSRTPEQRKRDVLARLDGDVDLWVATASSTGAPTMVPLSFLWHGGALLMSTRRTNPTARNVAPSGPMVVSLGQTRDVVLIEGTAEVVESAALDREAGEAFVAKMDGWDPRTTPPWVFIRLTPDSMKAWREENELGTRQLMRAGAWLV